MNFKLVILLCTVISFTFSAQTSSDTLAIEKDKIVTELQNRISKIKDEKAKELLAKLDSLKKQAATMGLSKYTRKLERLLDEINELQENCDECNNCPEKTKEAKKDSICILKYVNGNLVYKYCTDSMLKQASETKSPCRNSPFFFRVYTDVKGFSPEQPNGIFQTEFGFNWICNNGCRKKYEEQCNSNCKIYWFRNLMLPIVNLFQNKGDSSFRFTPVQYNRSLASPLKVDSFRNSLNIHTLNLIKYAQYSLSGKLNILTLDCPKRCLKLYADLYGTFYASGISYDSTAYNLLKIHEEDSKSILYSFGWGINIKARVKPRHSCFSLEAAYTLYGLHLLSKDVAQSYGPLYSPAYSSLNYGQPNLGRNSSNGIEEVGKKIGLLNNINVFNVEVKYSPKGNSSADNSCYFFRLNVFTNPLARANGNYAANTYVQIQTGISKSLDELKNFLGFK